MEKPTEKQIKYAWFLSKTTKLPLPSNWNRDRIVISGWIAGAKREMPEAVKSAGPIYEDEHTRRILSGGPLKNDPGPWDEEWCRLQK